MSTGIRCPNCSYENPLYGQFCSKCGQPVVIQCRVCGEDNVTDAKFCRSCAVELASAPKGLFLDRTMAWREQFRRMGWLEWSSLTNDDWGLVGSQNLPTVNDKHEPWIFGAIVDGATMKPESVSIDGKLFASGGLLGTRGFVVATRCRLGIFNAKSKAAKVWWYTELSGYQGHGSNAILVTTDKGEKISFAFKLPSAGLLEVATAIAASDPVAKTWARRGIEVKAGEQKSFIQIIGDFLHDIVIRVNE